MVKNISRYRIEYTIEKECWSDWIFNRFNNIIVRKKTLVFLTYLSYIYTAVISTLLIHNNHINIDVNNVNGLVILTCFSTYVVLIAIIEGIAIYKIKSRRMFLHILVILISFLLYFNINIEYVYLLIVQIFLIIMLFLIPFFAKYKDQIDESKRVLAYRYMFSQLIVFYLSIFFIFKFSHIIYYMCILLPFYAVI